ncbi:hypothetical protein LshimejAT787_2000110 [Lyophyllum shimeji]|uniref:DUF6532 domain-containing protein n=2 Tax=Lyophyllum shimeji TaxID=47721 RepID=A0A9P3Q1S8_LYOSH|nr:hypothetical protein LshimejAT787_2000110 [Lyophyllum shimeji]
MPKIPPTKSTKSKPAAAGVAKQQTSTTSRKKQVDVEANAAPQNARSLRSTTAGRGAAPTGRQKRPASPSKSRAPIAKKAKAAPAPTRTTRRTTATGSISSTRKPPADIPSEDDEEPDEPLPARSRRGSKEEASLSDNDEEVEDQNSNEDDEEYDDELERLDAKCLKTTLVAERPRWAAQTAGPDGDEDESEIIPRQDIEVISGTEFEHKDEDDEDDIPDHSACDAAAEGEEADEDGALERTRSAASSRRACERRAEVPRWGSADSEVSEAGTASDSANVQTAISNPANVNARWPLQAHYNPPPPGSRNLSLTSQPAPLHTLIKAAIRQVTGDALFVDMYPSVATIDDYFRQVLIKTANDLEYFALSDRLTTDKPLVDFISRLLGTRLSNVRCGAKKITLPKVETSFNLGGTSDERQEKAKALLASHDYMYPRLKDGNLILRTKPFHHPIIVSSMREYFFSATRGSMASKHAARFASSIPSGPQALELEVPLPMVCTIATAVYASINDWSSGFLKKSEFNADEYEDVYRGHEMFLNNIRTSKPGAYHRLMADLYKDVSDSQAAPSANIVANNAMSILDLDAMDE